MRTCLLAVALVSTPLSARQDRVELAVTAKAGADASAVIIRDRATRTLDLLDDWLGPLARPPLTIVDAPWRAAIDDELPPGMVVVRSRWHAPSRDRALEREVIAGITRQYWLPFPPDRRQWFREALALYTAGRAIDTLLEGSQFYADRYLGGFLSYPIRDVSLSPIARDARPRLRRYDELSLAGSGAAAGAHARRGAELLTMAERYLGWPAMQQVLAAFRLRFPAGGAVTDFAAVASEQAGRDLSWLFSEMFMTSPLDYAVTGLTSTPQAAAPGHFEVRVSIQRMGSAVFGDSPSLPVEVRFADGTSVRDWWDGRLEQGTLDYVSTSPAVAASIDPEVIMILDQDRANNAVAVTQPWSRLAVRLALNWAIWLQMAMLSYSGLA